ncbi:hypothetical protein OJF2_34710 [Aquisphaera giovannonii]|uniref:Uncharacterized protein n=1 Tax=Aquisphaera giovannonii TaxID=406548 RepID=A0A5B9W2U2_9BACT|nr:hypothetical protein [Aquisphaera giovannonii]QEH34926.1 hypothetical protein OJF2_34710 [Aquisphaera giovannonii]
MRLRFSIADLLWLAAGCAGVLAVLRWAGYVGALLAAPFLAAGVTGRLMRGVSAPAFVRWAVSTLAASGTLIGVWLADPGPHGPRPFDPVIGTLNIAASGVIAAATAEAWFAIRRELVQSLGGMFARRPDEARGRAGVSPSDPEDPPAASR